MLDTVTGKSKEQFNAHTKAERSKGKLGGWKIMV